MVDNSKVARHEHFNDSILITPLSSFTPIPVSAGLGFMGRRPHEESANKVGDMSMIFETGTFLGKFMLSCRPQDKLVLQKKVTRL
jgi:hypothetical protein